MTPVHFMLHADPKAPEGVDRTKLAECIQACFECAETCTACADTCVSEETAAELAICIRTNLDCVDICAATGKILSRHNDCDAEIARAAVQACRAACRACAAECAQHASLQRHCGVCAEACRRCERACTELLTSLG